MAYTNAWSDNLPAVGTAANQIGVAARQLRQDVHERMNTIVTDWTADPIVLIPAVSGLIAAPGRAIVIPPYILRPDNSDGSNHANYILGSNYYECAIAGNFHFGSFVLPVGYTVVLFEAIVDRNFGTSITVELTAVNMLTDAVVMDTGVLSAATAGRQTLTSSALTYVVAATDIMVVKVVGLGTGAPPGSGIVGGKVYGFRVTITKTDNSQGY